jgi:hypothetical protein
VFVENMSDIFISYSRNDQEVAEALALGFEQCGWTVFWDRKIPPGREWGDVIETELKQAKCVVVLWSNGSLHSTWVKEEASVAKEQEKLLPVRIENVKPPFGFTWIQCADLTQWEPGSYEVDAFRFLARATADIGRLAIEFPAAKSKSPKDSATTNFAKHNENTEIASPAQLQNTKQKKSIRAPKGEWYNALTGGGTVDVQYECKRCKAKGWIEKIEWFRDGIRPPSNCSVCGYTGNKTRTANK